MEDKCPDETWCMRGMNLNLCILSMLEYNFSLGKNSWHFHVSCPAIFTKKELAVISYFKFISRTNFHAQLS